MPHLTLPHRDALFAVSRPPQFLLDSASVGWSGAFFTDLQCASEGAVDHAHARYCLQRSRSPFEVQLPHAHGAWQWVADGSQLWHPGEEQRARWRRGGYRQFLFIAPERVEEILDAPIKQGHLNPWYGAPVANAFVDRMLDAMASDLADGSPAGPLVGDSLVTALVARLAVGGGDGSRAVGAFSPAVRKRLVAYIDQHLDTKITLTELSSVGQASVRQFCRVFQISFGCSPHQYLLRQRVERAKSLIQVGDLGLAEVALTSGFSDQSQLTRTFKRITGVNPMAYQRTARH